MTFSKKAIIELLKAFARFMWFGVLGLVVAFLTSLVAGGNIAGITIDIFGQTLNVGFLIVAAITFVAKGIDKYIHENPSITSNGIALSFLQK